MLGKALKAALGRSDDAGRQKAQVLATAYPEILVGVMEAAAGRGFRSAHPGLFEHGRVKDLDAAVRTVDSPDARQGGPSDDVLKLAEAALDNFRLATSR